MAKLQSIDFPWGKGIGTLGFNFATKHVDYSFNWLWEFIKFVAVYTAATGKQVQQRSWYKLTMQGWQLLRREDQFGRWYCGRTMVDHHPTRQQVVNGGLRLMPLLERPADIPQRAWQLRPLFKPYTMVDWYGAQLEVISYPSPESNSVTVMLRQFNDPTTMQEVVLEQYI